MNGSRWMEKITFCFGSEKNKRSVAREREKKSSKMTWFVHFQEEGEREEGDRRI